MKNSLKSYILNFALIIGITIIALWFALKDNYKTVLSLIFNIKWYWLVIIILWGILYCVVGGKILTILARRYKKDFRYVQGLQNGLVGSLFSGITPSATGGQFAQAYIFKKQGIKYSDGASILWADFIMYQTTMMGYVTVLFVLRFSHYVDIVGPWIFAILIGYFINVCVIGVLWTMALFPKVYIKLSRVFVRFLAKLHIIKNKEKKLAEWSVQMEGFTSEIKKLRHEKMLILKCVLLNITRLTIDFVLPFFIAGALGVSIGWDHFVDSLALASFVLMANAFIPIPGASGGTELVFTQLFKTLVNGASASSIMILWRFSTFHMVIIAGAVVFFYLKKKYADEKYRQDNYFEQEGEL